MKLLIISITVLFMTTCAWGERLVRGAVITNPPISSRCQILKDELHKYKLQKQKLIGLKKRNRGLKAALAKQLGRKNGKKGRHLTELKERIRQTGFRVKHEINFLEIKIKNTKWNLLKIGCPHINLSIN